MVLDLFQNCICLIKLPFLASFKSAQKISIFLNNVSFKKGLFLSKANVLAICAAVCVMNFFSSIEANEGKERLERIMQQKKYSHSQWGIFAKDANSGEILLDLHSEDLFLPGSVTKLFSVAAFWNAYGEDHRFKTPVYMKGSLQEGVLKGNLILVGQGDLTLGGRQGHSDKIAYTKMDHIYANSLPGAVLTKEDPMHGLNELAKQIKEGGITRIVGNILMDDRLFESVEKREMILTPLMINENLIDFLINPTEIDSSAAVSWRPYVPGYTIENRVKTVAIGEPLAIDVISKDGKHIILEGTLPIDQKDIVRVFSVRDPKEFARLAFIEALKNQGIQVEIEEESEELPSEQVLKSLEPIAVWISPPLSEYAKLILKVSHNLGADLIPLLLAVQKGQKTFDQGMLLFGKFLVDEVRLPVGSFVFIDGAGGDNNRVTPRTVLTLLDYVRKWPQNQFQKYQSCLPILGVNGSLEDFGKKTQAVGKVFAKTGTGVSYNLAIDQFFLNTQALAGYIEEKKGRLIEFMIVVNNAKTPQIADVIAVFEDQAQMSAIIYDSFH